MLFNRDSRLNDLLGVLSRRGATLALLWLLALAIRGQQHTYIQQEKICFVEQNKAELKQGMAELMEAYEHGLEGCDGEGDDPMDYELMGSGSEEEGRYDTRMDDQGHVQHFKWNDETEGWEEVESRPGENGSGGLDPEEERARHDKWCAAQLQLIQKSLDRLAAVYGMVDELGCGYHISVMGSVEVSNGEALHGMEVKIMDLNKYVSGMNEGITAANAAREAMAEMYLREKEKQAQMMSQEFYVLIQDILGKDPVGGGTTVEHAAAVADLEERVAERLEVPAFRKLEAPENNGELDYSLDGTESPITGGEVVGDNVGASTPFQMDIDDDGKPDMEATRDASGNINYKPIEVVQSGQQVGTAAVASGTANLLEVVDPDGTWSGVEQERLGTASRLFAVGEYLTNTSDKEAYKNVVLEGVDMVLSKVPVVNFVVNRFGKGIPDMMNGTYSAMTYACTDLLEGRDPDKGAMFRATGNWLGAGAFGIDGLADKAADTGNPTAMRRLWNYLLEDLREKTKQP